MLSSNKLSIEALAARLRLGSTVAIVLTALMTAAAMTGGLGSSAVAIRVDGEGLSSRSTAVCALAVGLLCLGFLWEIRAALGRIADGDSFGPTVRSRLSRASLYMLAGCFTNILLPSVMMFVWPMAGTTRHFALEISGSDALWLLTATCLFFIARLLERAEAFESDSRQVV